MRVDDALGVGGGTRRVADDDGGVGVGGRGGDVFAFEDEVVERDRARRLGVAHHGHEVELGGALDAAGEVADEVAVAEAVGRDQRLCPGLPQDVVDLLGPVEVHDRHEHHAEHRGAVERDAGLEAVRHLEGDDVAFANAAGRQAGSEPAGEHVELTHRVARRPGVRPHAELEPGVGRQAVHDVACERVVGPVTPGEVALAEFGRGLAHLPVRGSRSRHAHSMAWN